MTTTTTTTEASEEAKAGDWDDVDWGGCRRRGMSREGDGDGNEERSEFFAIGAVGPRGRPGGSDHPDGRGRAAGPGTTGGGPHGGRRRPPSFVVRGRGPDDARPSGRGTLRKRGRRCRATPYTSMETVDLRPPRAGRRSRSAATTTTNTDRLSIAVVPTVAHCPITTGGSIIIVEIAIVDYRVAIGQISNHDATSDLPRRNRNTTTKI